MNPEYKLVVSYQLSTEHLNRQITALMALGYTPHGDPFAEQNALYQAMVFGDQKEAPSSKQHENGTTPK